ncbi:MAG: F0F1 ATP synthase subunit A [Anaerolineae bacterium]
MRRLVQQKTFWYAVAGLGLLIALFAVTRLFLPPVVMPAVSIAPEGVLHLGGFAITNTLLASWITMLVLIVVSFLATRRMELVPRSRLQNLYEMILEGFYKMVEDVVGPEWARSFFPIVMTIFLFIVTSNWLGLTPLYGGFGVLEHPHQGEPGYQVRWIGSVGILTGELAAKTAEAAAGGEEGSGTSSHASGGSPSGYILAPLFRSAATDLNTTIGLALVSVILTQYFGLKAQGFQYLRRFFAFRPNFLGIIEAFVGLLELVSEFAKIISFSFRLFGNIFAGEVLLGVMAFLIPYVVSLPFYGLELFVGLIQALIFMMLTVAFFKVAVSGAEH